MASYCKGFLEKQSQHCTQWCDWNADDAQNEQNAGMTEVNRHCHMAQSHDVGNPSDDADDPASRIKQPAQFQNGITLLLVTIDHDGVPEIEPAKGLS
jgi:hypothetical protein